MSLKGHYIVGRKQSPTLPSRK